MARLIRRFALGLLALAMTTPSFAADLPRAVYKAPPMLQPLPYSWTGFYVGVNGGYAWGKADVSNATGSFQTGNQDGWLLGPTIGYNLQTGSVVFGVEGDIDYAFIKGNATNFATCGPGGTCEVKNTWLATARGRLGFAWDRFMLYGTGGGAFAGAKITPSTGGSATRTTTGWTVGGGAEYGLAAAWTVKLEYLYADLGKSNCDVCTVPSDVRPKINIVRAGLNYRF